MTNVVGTVYRSRPPRELVFRYFLLSILLFSFSHCYYFPIISLFAKIINWWAVAGPDRTSAGGNRNAGETGGSKGYMLCILFVFSTQFISSSRSSSFPIVYSLRIGKT